MNLHDKLMEKLRDAQPEMIKIRRRLHAHPEVSFHEKETAKYIKDFYHDLNYSYFLS